MTDRRDEDEDEEEQQEERHGSAWWAGYRTAEEDAAAGFSGAYRGTKPVPHGGSITVTHATGSLDLCWCGEPFNHDWPGKASGVRHPRVPRKETMSSGATDEDIQRIERRSLRAYNADLADVILASVNDYGAKYRETKNSIILYAPDGSQPYTVHARNSDRQVKPARMWFVRHCVGTDKEPEEVKKVDTEVVDPDKIRELAQAVNSPEHEVPEPEPEQSSVTEPDDEAEHGEPYDPDETAEWKPYYTRGSKEPHPLFETNGTDVRCKEDGWVGKAAGTGGHVRTAHRDTSTMWGAEARAKASETHKNKKASEAMASAVEILQAALGVKTADPKEITKLREEIARLTGENTALRQQVNDFEAKQALMREALGL